MRGNLGFFTSGAFRILAENPSSCAFIAHAGHAAAEGLNLSLVCDADIAVRKSLSLRPFEPTLEVAAVLQIVGSVSEHEDSAS